MVQNVVLNNASHAFSVYNDALRAQFDQTAVVPTPGTAAAIAAHERAQLAAGSFVSSGRGIHVDSAG
jgi:hypothetical protein